MCNWVLIWLKSDKSWEKACVVEESFYILNLPIKTENHSHFSSEKSTASSHRPHKGHHKHQLSLRWPAVTFEYIYYQDYLFAFE